jgi:hypothetical protein
MSGPVASVASQPQASPQATPHGQVTVTSYAWGEGNSQVQVQWPADVRRGDAAAQARYIRQTISELTNILSNLPA